MRRGIGCLAMLLATALAFTVIGSLVVGAGFNGQSPLTTSSPGQFPQSGGASSSGFTLNVPLVVGILAVSLALYVVGLWLLTYIPTDMQSSWPRWLPWRRPTPPA